MIDTFAEQQWAAVHHEIARAVPLLFPDIHNVGPLILEAMLTQLHRLGYLRDQDGAKR